MFLNWSCVLLNPKATLDTNFKAYTEYDLPNGNLKQVTLFVSEVPSGVVVTRQQAEISAIGWFDYAAARERLTYDNLKQMLDQANTYIEQHLQ